MALELSWPRVRYMEKEQGSLQHERKHAWKGNRRKGEGPLF